MDLRDINSDESQVPYYDSLEYQIKLARQGARKLRTFCFALTFGLAVSICLTLISVLIAVGAIQETNRLEYRQESMKEDVSSVLSLRDELREANQKVLLEVWQSVPDVLHKVETDISSKLTDFKAEVDSTVKTLEKKSDSELTDFSKRLHEELDELDVDIKKTQAIFRNMSDAFVSVEVANQHMLSPHEQLLLTLIARETNPRNPELNLKAAKEAYALGHYDRARELATIAMKLNAASPEVISDARALRSNAKKMKKMGPRQIKHESPGRTRVGPYGIFALHYNTLCALVDHGFLSVEEAQDILEQSKQTMHTNP